MRKTYTPAEIDTALLVFLLSGNNSVVTCQRLKEQGIDVNARTLRNWKDLHADRLAEIASKHAPEIERQMITTAREIVLKANAGTLEAIDAALAQVRDGSARDASHVARNLATVAGIQTDKSLLVEGRPTTIVGNDLEGLLERAARALGIPRPIDSTAEELEPALLPESADEKA